MKYTNHPACMNVKPALSLLQCLRSRPATSSHGSRPQWSQKTGQLKIKAVYPCIQTTEPKLGTGSSDISNIQCLQSSQIPPYSLLKKQLTLHVHNRGGGGRIQLTITSTKVGNPRMQLAEPAWGWVYTMQQSLKCLQADRSLKSSARSGGRKREADGRNWKHQTQNPRDPFQKQLSTTTAICQATLGTGWLGSLPVARHTQGEELHWRQGLAGSRRRRSDYEGSAQ